MYPPTDSVVHAKAFDAPVLAYWLKEEYLKLPIAPWADALSQSYISLLNSNGSAAHQVWMKWPSLRWHCTKSSDCQVRVRGAPSNVYGVNVTKAVIGAYMWQWWLVQILWHLPYVFSSFWCLMNYYTVTFATCWYMGWVKILQLTFCVNLRVVTVNFL